ncbi:MAG: hypothetical protein IBX52_03400 [Bacterioplanes sp.]|nr:hypothetical protein [Bacterioplanes sp.]
MSLIHQVLRDIDQRQVNTQSIPAALQVSESSLRRPLMVFIVIGVLMLALGLGWYWQFRQPASDAGASSVSNVATLTQQNDLLEREPVVLSNADSVLVEVATHELQATVPVVTNAVANESKPDLSAEKTPEPSVKSTTEANQVVVVRHQQPARALYLQALNDAQQGQWSEALRHIEQALTHESAEEYLILKLRVLLEQKNTDGFLTWYQQHQRLHNPDWWAVAAPGLHMQGYYDEAILLYQRLQRAQPTIVNWPLAQVLALKQAQRGAEVESILRTLPQRYALTDAQQRWVQQQLQERTR